MFPDELKGLTPVEEKLISLNSCYGFGHITVFPNNVQELATKVLPPPLQALDEIHISWQGAEKPAPSDLSSLLSVRRRVVERALVWLKRNNPHYAEIEIDAAEMESWGDSIHGADGARCAAHGTRRGRGGPVEIEELFALLNQGQEAGGQGEGHGPNGEGAVRDGSDACPDQNVPAINEVTSSGMFALDGPPDVADVEKLQFACDAVGEGADDGRAGPRAWVGSLAGGVRGRGDGGCEPYIRVSRGEFTDSFEASFFARTFPTLFPFGVGDQERLAAARVELESSGKTTDGDVKELLRSLSLYGHRQPMSREVRLNMRRKIQSLIVGYGVPGHWFTINPNDITNPVKLRLAAYRTRDPDAAEEFLEGLGDAYKRARLAISDPMSSAVFFHREMKLFFDHYVKRLLRGSGPGKFCAVQAERSVTGGIGSLLDNAAQFSAAFIEEANFCAGATQVHTHSPTCVKYSLGKGGRKGDLCRFKAPWRLVDKTALTADGVLQIRRTHSMVNRWNEAIAVGLRHNHDISFIATQRKTMALIYYVTNYATKVEDPVWKRVAAAAELLAASTGNRTRQFLMRVANRVFTERPLSQVEVVAHLLGYPAEFTDSSAWAYLNCSLLYWEVFRRWRHLREASGAAAMDDTLDESVLRRPGKHATVCLDGYLSKDFTYDDESCYRRAAVQHLALFVPWESFLGEGTGEINSIWARARDAMAPRISCLVDNVQLLRRSAEDAKRDAKQWAASSGDGDPTVAHVEEGGAGEAGAESAATYQPNSIGDATRLIDVVRGAVGANQVTAKSPELMAMIQQLWRVFSGAALPPQDQVKAIKSQQRSPRSVAKGDDRFREDEVEMTMADSDETAIDAGAGMDVQFGPSTSFLAAGKVLATRLTLNKRQSIAFLIICRQLDLIQQTDGAMPASCASSSAERFIHGQSRMDWQEKDVLVIDEVSMLGARTLHAVNERLRRLRGSRQDFGGIPIVLFCGDFQQFRPVQERSIVLPSAAISWDVDNSFKAEQRHQHDKAHALWKRFTTVVMLDEQMRAAGDPELQRLLKRIRLGVQDRTDLNLLNSRNRWNLNMEASLAFRVQQRSTMRIFISEHKWKEELPTEEEAIMILNQGDDSAIPVPAVFMFVAGMPIVVNHNTHQGLKLVNGASYSAVEVIVDKAYPGHRISADMTIHFGPPAGIILESETTRYLHFCQRKRPWQRNDVSRKGLPCAAAFACTDYKVQGKTLERVALELRGHGRRRWMERWCPRNGIMLVSKVRDRDLVGNRVPEEMTAAQARLEVLSERTVEEALRWLDGDAEESRRPR
ncbi:PIF1-like helicase [Hirsutella rhossiliensis]|uniref:ATP-dependent DNA helicase n=1 Tax=Hirsutella rhossiliensis TaxID=111463 RepID=A0A9P8MZM9_9HYPO|nr:PIF1-like helicase domain-containing protein [Hirsutella rhossiliensis]KAH0962052.1 PIF1-like helicase domain-containing protein [Hirsutella rhossiliensis]